jgi:hypothetical protein
MRIMQTRYLAFALTLVGCSSSSGSPLGPKADGGETDAPLIVIDARAHDAKGDVAHDAAADVTHDAATDVLAKTDAPAPYPAMHPPMPQEVNSGGPVMTAPKFVVITFAGDTLAPNIDDFADKVAASATYWSGTTAEYGVGPIASVVHISLNETPATALADVDVQTWLTQQLTGADAGVLEGGAPWPQPDGETVYMIYYPATVTVTQGGQTSCQGFYGYHNDYVLTGSTYVTYSVVARCAPFQGASAIDSIASIASHEMIEAVTDPLPQDNPAWISPDTDHTAWAVPAGGELGDMCAGYGNVFYKPTDVPYLVQRSWSNKAAAAGHDPCQPEGATPYFNAAAVLNDTVTVNDPVLGMYTTKGVKIPVGGTGTVTLDLYSDAPAPAWEVQAFDFASLFGGSPDLEVTVGGQAMGSGVNGGQLTLDIKVLQAGSGIFWVQNGNGSSPPVWIGVVGN